MPFVYLHIVWFTLWIALGVEKFPFGFLTMLVSLEAIFLSTFVMISQNRADEKRAGLAEHQWQLVQEEEKQNEELITISRQILELTKDIHSLTKGSGGHLARPGPPRARRSDEQREHLLEAVPQDGARRPREDPRGHDLSGDPPTNRGEALRRADAHDRRPDRVRRRHRDPEVRRHRDHGGRAGLRGEPLHGLQVGHPHPERAHDPPAADHRAEAHHERRRR